MIDVSDYEGIEPTRTDLLGHLAREARAYLLAHEWCDEVRHVYLAENYGATVLLVEIESHTAGVDQQVWVITGDAPLSYMDVESCPNPLAALCEYCIGVFLWAQAVLKGKDTGDCIQLHAHGNFRPLVEREDATALQPFIFGMARALLEHPDTAAADPAAPEALKDVVKFTKRALDAVYGDGLT